MSYPVLDDNCSVNLDVNDSISAVLAPGSCGTLYEQRNDLIAIRNQDTVSLNGAVKATLPFGCNVDTVGYATPVGEHVSHLDGRGKFKIK